MTGRVDWELQPLVERVLRLQVIGMPGPQGSKRHVGGGRMIESSAKVKPWRESVVWSAREAMAAETRARDLVAPGRLPFPLRGPLWLEMTFTLPKPKSAPKTRRTFPDRKPDVSKLARSTEDALVTAGLIEDDARIVGYRRLLKVFPGEGVDALDVPGVVIEIYQPR